MESLESGFQHHEIRLADLELHYVREGKKGSPLLLLHEPDGFWWDWSRNIGALSEYFDVIVPDLRGCGRSGKPPVDKDMPYHADKVTEDMVQLLQALEIREAFVVGHGWSTIVVHKMIRRQRELVRRAVMLNAALPGVEDFIASNRAHSWYLSFVQSDLATALIRSGRQACEAFIRSRLSHGSANAEAFDERDIQLYADNLMEPGTLPALQAFYRTNLAPHSNLWKGMDKTVSSCNVTFLQGVKDPFFPAEWVSLASRWYNRGSFEYLPDAGHYLMREAPEWVNYRLRLLKT